MDLISSAGVRVGRRRERVSKSYFEQGILDQQHRVPIGNVVFVISGGDGKREHAVPQELGIAHRHQRSI